VTTRSTLRELIVQARRQRREQPQRPWLDPDDIIGGSELADQLIFPGFDRRRLTAGNLEIVRRLLTRAGDRLANEEAGALDIQDVATRLGGRLLALLVAADEIPAEARLRLESFRRVLAAYFGRVTEGREYKRRPNVSILLHAPGEPPARLAALPSWDRRSKRFNAGEIDLEMLVERSHYMNPWHPVLCLTLAERGPRVTRESLSEEEDFRARMLRLVDSFLADPAAVITQRAAWCGFCGRALTDEQSRARGVGPECLRRRGTLFDVWGDVLAL
jgi:hypothetical protein